MAERMENQDYKKNVYQQRERYRQKAFLMMLEIAAILAIPAFVALFLGKYLYSSHQSGNTYKYILLFASFILSWAIIIIKYLKFSKKVKENDRKIKELKEKDGIDN